MHVANYCAVRAPIALLLLFCASVTNARPAPWYQWRSLADGALQCAQTSLGPGWVRDSGPYRDAHCLHALRQVRL